MYFMITGFQLRAARSSLSLYLKDVTDALGLHTSTLTRLEAQTPNLSYISSNNRTSLLLKKFYENRQVIFPYYNSIGIISEKEKPEVSSRFSRFQLKISRIALRLSRKKLGSILNIPETSIAGWETKKNLSSIFIPQNIHILSRMQIYFNSRGIIYKNSNIVELLDDPVDINIK